MSAPLLSLPSAARSEADVFRAAFDSAPTAMALLSPAGTILQANRALNTLLSYGDDALHGLDVLDVTHPDDSSRGVMTKALRQLAHGEVSQVTSEKRYIRRDGDSIWVEEVLAPLAPSAAGHDRFIAQIVEIGARRRAEAKFRMVFDAAGIGISTGPAGMLAETNPAYQRMLGYSAEELSGMHYKDITHPDDHELDAKQMADLVSGRKQSFTVEKRYVRRDGSVIWVRVTVTMAPDGSFGIGLIEDISERRRLLARTVEAAEGERMAIAAELHDGPIQHLTALAFSLDLLVKSLERERDDRNASLARKTRAAVSGEIVSLRRTMSGLRPQLIDERGLDTAIRECAETALGDTPTTYAVDSRLDGRLPPELESAIYQLIRETLLDVRKRSQARHVHVGVVARSATVDLSIEIEEPGCGAIAEPAARSHQVTMRERVESLGGSLQETELPDGRFVIAASFPSAGSAPGFPS